MKFKGEVSGFHTEICCAVCNGHQDTSKAGSNVQMVDFETCRRENLNVFECFIKYEKNNGINFEFQ